MFYSDGALKGNCGSAYTKFNTAPIDSTVKVFKLPKEEMPHSSTIVKKPTGSTFAKGIERSRNAENRVTKADRIKILDEAIVSGKVSSIAEAMEHMKLSRITIVKYLHELNKTLAD